jgi:alpha-galactosidase
MVDPLEPSARRIPELAPGQAGSGSDTERWSLDREPAMSAITLEGAEHGALRVHGLGAEPVPIALRIELRDGGGAPVDLAQPTPGPGGGLCSGPVQLRLLAQRDGDALELGWRLVNDSAHPVMLDGVGFEISGEGWPLLRESGRLRLYQHGYQSWTPSGAVAGDRRPVYPLLRSFALMNHFVDSPFWGRRDGLISSLLTLLQGGEGEPVVLLGFTAQRAGLGELFYRNRGVPWLQARLDYGGKRLRPGEILEGEPLRIARGDADGLLQDWAASIAGAMGARVPACSPVGWCSWYEYYTRVVPRDLHGNTDFLAAHPELGVSFVQLDDGYQPHVGDWLERNDKFSAGLEPIARCIRERGFQAGLWTAPFLASAGSRLLAEHPDWFLRDARGPVAAGFNPEWRARTCSLDLSHPEVLAWLGEVFGTLVAEGFDYHKIDFLFAGLRHGDRHDPGVSPVQAYRQGLAAIREAIGPERFLLGCGAPLGPSVGMVDGMRVSQDVKEQWDSWLAGWVGRGCGYPAARGALRTNMTRWFMHRALWVNDPDCLLVREHDTRLSEEETRTLVSVLGATGGMLFLSDDLPRVSPQRLDLAAATLPPTRLVGRPSSVLAEAFPVDMVVEGVAGQRLVVLVNWSGHSVRRELPGEVDGGTWFDFWKGELVEVADLELAPHGVRALRFVPSGASPRVLGDTLHLLAAVDGRLRVDLSDDGEALVLRCAPIARRAGRVHLVLPVGRSLDASALPAGVSLVGQAGGRAELAVDRAAPWELVLAMVVEA